MNALELAKNLLTTVEQLVAQAEAETAELETLRSERSTVVAALQETRIELIDRIAAIERRLAAIQPTS